MIKRQQNKLFKYIAISIHRHRNDGDRYNIIRFYNLQVVSSSEIHWKLCYFKQLKWKTSSKWAYATSRRLRTIRAVAWPTTADKTRSTEPSGGAIAILWTKSIPWAALLGKTANFNFSYASVYGECFLMLCNYLVCTYSAQLQFRWEP